MPLVRLRTVVFFAASLALSCAGQEVEGRPTRAATARSDDPWLLGERCTPDTPTEPALRVEVLSAGIGDPVEEGATVRVHYAAGFPTGVKLHDSHEAGAPSEIIIGSTRTICGFERALIGMRPGEERRVFVPWSLAFGESGRSPEIPPHSDLVFVIDLYLPADVITEQHRGATNPAGRGGGGGRRR